MPNRILVASVALLALGCNPLNTATMPTTPRPLPDFTSTVGDIPMTDTAVSTSINSPTLEHLAFAQIECNDETGLCHTSLATVLVDDSLGAVEPTAESLKQFQDIVAPNAAPNGRLLTIIGIRHDRSSALYIFDLVSGELTTIPFDESQFFPIDITHGVPAWSSDSRTIAFSAHTGNPYVGRRIFAWDLSEQQLSGILDNDLISSATGHTVINLPPAWSPDNERLAFVRFIGDQTTVPQNGNSGRLFIKNLSDGSIHQQDSAIFIVVSKPHYLANVNSPAWSPDSKWLAYLEGKLYPKIKLLNIETGETRWLTDDLAPEYYPSWSPDGTALAYVSERDGNPEIYRHDFSSNTQSNLTQNPAAEFWPLWSPSNDYIVFVSDRDGHGSFPGQIFKMHAITRDGSTTRPIADTYVYGPPTWVALDSP